MFATLLVLSTAACAERPPAPGMVFPAPPIPTVPPPAPNLLARIYIDATLSMQGFAQAGPSTTYARLMQALERAFVAGWPRSKLEFFKFGSTIRRIEGKGYLEALRPDFYLEPQIFKTTRIDEVLQKASPEAMLVVITDLFQHDSDVAAMVRALRDRIFSHQLAVGVLGIRSEFNGVVYDVTLDRLKFPYKSQAAKPDTYRPVYVLVIGREPDIAKYHEELLRTVSPDRGSTEFVLLSPRVLGSPLTWSRSVQSKTTGGLRVNSDFLPNRDGSIGGFDLPSLESRPVLTAALPVNRIKYAPDILFEKTSTGVIAKRFRREGFPLWTRDVVTDPPSPGVTVKIVSKGTATVDLIMEFRPDELRAGGIYMYRIQLYGQAEAFTLPEWCRKWGVGARELNQWVSANRFDGSRTLNLVEFVADAVAAMASQTRPEIGRIDVYVKTSS